MVCITPTLLANEVKERNGNYSCTVQVLESINAVAPIAIALGVEVDSVVYRSVIIHNENDHDEHTQDP